MLRIFFELPLLWLLLFVVAVAVAVAAVAAAASATESSGLVASVASSSPHFLFVSGSAPFLMVWPHHHTES